MKIMSMSASDSSLKIFSQSLPWEEIHNKSGFIYILKNTEDPINMTLSE